MASIKELLLNTLEELVQDELKLFQWHLTNNHECISKSQMENADRLKTVDKMVACLGPEEAVKVTVDILRKINQNDLAEKLENNHKKVSPCDIKQRPERNNSDTHTTGKHLERGEPHLNTAVPKTRSEFLQYSHPLTLDMNTVHTLLHLSEDKRVITGRFPEESYIDHPERFDHYPQVLCRESVSGRSYWEIEWSGSVVVQIAVSYQGISRKGSGNECVFGSNDQSWTLVCSSRNTVFLYNTKETHLPVVCSGRVGVYVDHSAGTLSFYRVDRDTMSLIHKAQTTFTQPLYPGFGVALGTVKLLKN
ncbi:stonustoxin subunit beta-like [Rhinichthys klamathensis goyatoka]|uniref:stonustoxin subunit beta-like n=1 Tax=Rhinichthys klamathensis goyatoka TaxID=3034132 RepID=UPI0024B62998|nr:stonustoxin subunit beta-like [Rhinichthys klamathensis goyatoka]